MWNLVDSSVRRDSIDAQPEPRKPRTLVVLLMLVAAAAAFSYLSAYALTDALIAAEVIHRWPIGRDPRPRWMAIAFVTILSVALLVAMAFRFMSQRQLREIDRMHEA